MSDFEHDILFDSYSKVLHLLDLLFDINEGYIAEILDLMVQIAQEEEWNHEFFIFLVDKACSPNIQKLNVYVDLAKQIYDKYPESKLFKNFSCGELSMTLSNNQIYFNNETYQAIIDDDVDYLINLSSKDSNFNFNDVIFFRSYINISAMHGSSKCFKFLLSNNAEINEQTLIHAFEGGDLEIINMIEQKFVPDQNCIDAAVKFHNNDAVYYLMDKYNLDYSYSNCAESYNLELFFFKLSNEVQDNKIKSLNESFTDMIFFGLKSLIKLYVENGVDINSTNINNWTALVVCIILNLSPSVAKYLIEKKIDVDAIDVFKMSVLMMCALRDNIEIAKILIENGANINQKDAEKRSILMLAKSPEFVSLLIDHGCDLKVLNCEGYNALEYAVKECDYIKVKYLLENSKIEIRTSLKICCIHNYDEIAKLLIDHGANINQYDEYPLLFYCQIGDSMKTARLLLKHNFDLTNYEPFANTLNDTAKFISKELQSRKKN